MRVKNETKTEEKNDTFGVTDGLDFGMEVEEIAEEVVEQPVEATKPQKKAPAKKAPTKAEVDPNRAYSPYYTPKPKLGSKGGTLGRGAVDKSERKVQFSLTCTPAQKEMFSEAAKKEKRKLPDFICLAVEEYIENHNL
jgi:hypothetical protein